MRRTIKKRRLKLNEAAQLKTGDNKSLLSPVSFTLTTLSAQKTAQGIRLLS
jgi:hypothetical protein